MGKESSDTYRTADVYREELSEALHLMREHPLACRNLQQDAIKGYIILLEEELARVI